jgi:environmental stress-induced protein Ves
MRLLDPATYREMQWKNGRGRAVEILTLPPDADLESFDARVSLAHVDRDGAFSAFPGVDRTLVLTDGVGMTLSLADESTIAIDRSSPPVAFTADDPCHGALTDGPISDFNVMTRRRTFRHRVRRVTLEGDQSVTCTGELTLLVVLTGTLVAEEGDMEIPLSPKDILALGPGEPLVCLSSEGRPELLLVDIWRR